jgi:hypothetical protein
MFLLFIITTIIITIHPTDALSHLLVYRTAASWEQTQNTYVTQWGSSVMCLYR